RCGCGAHICAGSGARRSQRSAAGAARRRGSPDGQRAAAWRQRTKGRDPGNGPRRRHLGVCRARPRRPAQGRAQYRVGDGASAQVRHFGFHSDVYCLVGGRAFARVPAAGVIATDDRVGRGRQVLCSLRAGALGSAFSFGMVTLLFAMMFKWLPDTYVAWRDVWPGAAVTAALFEIGKLLIGLYIGKQALESTYGAAASLVVLLIWVYYSSQLVRMGAEFTRAYATRRALGNVSASNDQSEWPAPNENQRARDHRPPSEGHLDKPKRLDFRQL